MSLAAALSLEFYCDLCVEVANEPHIDASLSPKEAETKRTVLRGQEAVKRDKVNKFRICYIAQKITSVLCDDEDGEVVEGYTPIDNGHPFDTTLPRTGANMFEDIDVPPPNRTKPERRESCGKTGPLTIRLDVSDFGDEFAELSTINRIG
ncbi:hypothetical protein BU25DRAFT_474581 [Macroventuria anomochaeta]|uniref:Uncharacterized protein n=1 Tax=Macroventuria anomochaeta TaxID=301207 RepID=A0ACB6RTD8_9PLEO|nr:uncharacterized protein BU25DRAFT_474581 [Macroventuria anomochaeta]KAF2625024.1 hypothetical protein BU25DRAFT_474581 [Macroventuria anomochaeta]